MRISIVGGGIGGLAAALALRRVGVEALVIERVPNIQEVGAGLSLWSNATNALRELGVESRVMAAASVVDRNTSQSVAGRPIAVTDLAEVSREAGAPCICVHRAVLQRILLEALPPGSVRTGARCVDFEGSTAVLESGERIAADVLVGADGISSVIRARLHKARPPRYAGYGCWRGICRADGALPDRSAMMVLGPGSQFGLWPCGAGKLYWFLTKNAPQGSAYTKADAVAVCRGWAAASQVIEATPDGAILYNDVVDRPPLHWWGRGNVTLLGDAAHATTPNLGQGACQALEDAVTLAHCLHSGQPLEAALRKYERLRIPRTTAVVNDSRRNGRLLQLDQPTLVSLRNRFLATSFAGRMGNRMFRKLLTYPIPKLQD